MLAKGGIKTIAVICLRRSGCGSALGARAGGQRPSPFPSSAANCATALWTGGDTSRTDKRLPARQRAGHAGASQGSAAGTRGVENCSGGPGTQTTIAPGSVGKLLFLGGPPEAVIGAQMKRLILRRGREKSLKQHHPWIFSGAIERLEGSPAPGETVAVADVHGEFLALAAYSPASQIRARVWSFDDEPIDTGFLRRRLAQAWSARGSLLPPGTSAFRWVHGESDGLPGLVIDVYDQTLVIQVLSAGAEYWRDAIVEAATVISGRSGVFERSDADVRALEGLSARVGGLSGHPESFPLIEERGLRFRVDIKAGQKTGFYLDQRDNRQRIGELARDLDVLNGFCYTGGFSLSALRGGARSVLSIDSSRPALDAAQENMRLNALDEGKAEWMEADVFAALRRLRDQGRTFGLIVLDPPKFAPTAHHAEKAARAYKDINLFGLKLLKPGGLLATFSCSGGVGRELFQKIVAGAALDAGIDAQIVGRFSAAADHPVALNFPEGDYLKGVLVRRMD